MEYQNNIELVVGYLRVSTEEQAAEGVSLEAQRQKIEAWRELNAPQAELVFYEDAGISGKAMHSRPALQEALRAACRRGAALVVYSLSRLSRSTQDTLHMADRLERAGAELVSLAERLDTTSASGKMLFRLLAVLAEFERDLIGERTKVAMAQLRAEGKRFTRWEPYPQAIIDRVRTLRDDGRSYAAIARVLESEGVQTRGGGTWTAKVVRDLALRRRPQGGTAYECSTMEARP